MEFLLFPVCGLVLSAVVFLSSKSISRGFAYYIFWLLGIISFVMSVLLFLTAAPEERLSAFPAHLIFGIIGFISIMVATAASQRIERVALYSKITEERQLRAISEITQLAASNSNLLELLNFALGKIVNMLGFAGGAIHVFHRAKDSLVLGSYNGLSPRLARRIETIEVGDTSIGRTAKNKRLLIIRDLRLSQDYEFFGGKQDGFTYMALVPIVSEGENWGVITLFGKGAYQPGSLQVDILEQFGEQIGAALVLGRRVRHIESSRDSFSALIKALGEELCDTSSISSGARGSVRGIAWLVTRLFGGDRFELCRFSGNSWTVTLSSEPTMEGGQLHPSGNADILTSAAGIINWDQEGPFEEFVPGKSYCFTSLNEGRDWIFIRLEGRRKAAVDLELLSDAFKIVVGLNARFDAIQSAFAEKQTGEVRATLPAKSAPEFSAVLERISTDIERLIAEYSGSKRESDLRELFTWLDIIRNTAKKSTEAAQTGKISAAASESPPRGFVEIVQEVASKVARDKNGDLELVLDNGDGLLLPEISPEIAKKSVFEFLTAAIFNFGKATLHLTSQGANNTILLELRGENLAPAPKGGDKPAWLQEINGRMECKRVEYEHGKSIDTWRLSIPSAIQNRSISGNNVIRVLAVDSQEIIRELLKGMLASLGHESVVVGSTSEARDLFKANLEEGKLYTHVIMDYNLDKMTGLEFARELKSLSPEVFCILISSWGLSPDADLAARMGIDRILKKPFRMEQLAEIIDASRGALH